jgi:hypothetical protein
MKLAALGLGVPMAGSSAWAHRAFAAEFDETKPLQLRGGLLRRGITPPGWKQTVSRIVEGFRRRKVTGFAKNETRDKVSDEFRRRGVGPRCRRSRPFRPMA